MTLTFDLDGQCHILFLMVDYMDTHVKTNASMVCVVRVVKTIIVSSIILLL